MSGTHTRNWVVLKRAAGSKDEGAWRFHRSFASRKEAWAVAKAMKTTSPYETKTVKRADVPVGA
jgi:hypothetical protein